MKSRSKYRCIRDAIKDRRFCGYIGRDFWMLDGDCVVVQTVDKDPIGKEIKGAPKICCVELLDQEAEIIGYADNSFTGVSL